MICPVKCMYCRTQYDKKEIDTDNLNTVTHGICDNCLAMPWVGCILAGTMPLIEGLPEACL